MWSGAGTEQERRGRGKGMNLIASPMVEIVCVGACGVALHLRIVFGAIYMLHPSFFC